MLFEKKTRFLASGFLFTCDNFTFIVTVFRFFFVFLMGFCFLNGFPNPFIVSYRTCSFCVLIGCYLNCRSARMFFSTFLRTAKLKMNFSALLYLSPRLRALCHYALSLAKVFRSFA